MYLDKFKDCDKFKDIPEKMFAAWNTKQTQKRKS